MTNKATISDVMTPSPLSIDINASLVAAQQLMSENKIRHLPVTEAGKAVSVITDRDINLAIAAHKNLSEADDLLVEEVCALNLYQVSSDTSLAEVVGYMAENTVGSVLITDDDELMGIFTATDACKYLALCLRGEFD